MDPHLSVRISLLLLVIFHYVNGQIYWSFSPNNRAAGQVPSYAVAVISNLDVHFGSRSFDSVTFTYIPPSLRCQTTMCITTGMDSWTPWNKLAPSISVANPAVEPSLQATSSNVVVGAATSQTNIMAYSITTQNGCRLIPSISADGYSLTGLSAAAWGRQDNPTNSMAACRHGVAEWIMFHIPYYLLAVNPEFPNVVITTTALVQTNTQLAGAFAIQGNGGAARTPVTVLTPWVTTVPDTAISALQFRLMVPSDRQNLAGAPNTIQNSGITSLRVGFIPGVQLLSSSVITLEVRGGARFFQVPTVTATVSIGPNCGSNPLSAYCCSSSTIAPTLTTLAAGVLPNMNVPPGWSTVTMTLLPDGCIIPADKYVEFTLPAAVLGTNPPIATIAAGAPNGIGFFHVDARMQTTAEPVPVHFQRYSETWPLGWLLATSYTGTTAGVLTYAAGDGALTGLLLPVQNVNQLPTPIGTQTQSVYGPSAYVVGLSQVTGFTAVPETTLTNSPINTLIIQFTSGLALPAVSTTPAGGPFVPWAYVITATAGIFRANIGTPAVPRVLNVALPTTCNGVSSYFTSSWGTFYFFPLGNNGANAAAGAVGANCATSLRAQAAVQIRFTIPSDALLPNPSTGTDVRFDIRFISSLEVNADIAAGTTAGDGAALMNQVGWTTTAGCSQSNSAPAYVPAGVNDIGGLAYSARCSLVHSISTISPFRAAFMQCPAAATSTSSQYLATFVKVPEGAWTLNSWPGTNYALSLVNWPQSVGLTGTPAVSITNWGYMFSLPMYAVVVSYPPTTTSINSLGIAASVPSNFQLVFLVRLNRLTVQCSVADLNNPWQFQVATCSSMSRVSALLTTAAAWNNVETLAGSSWGTGNCNVFVTMGQGGAVAGWTTSSASPGSGNSGSDDALFGLLALIAIPLLLLACLAWALWHFRPVEPLPYAPEYPVQEMYWVNQPVPFTTSSMVPAAYPQAAPLAPLSAPPATPLYLVQ